MSRELATSRLNLYVNLVGGGGSVFSLIKVSSVGASVNNPGQCRL